MNFYGYLRAPSAKTTKYKSHSTSEVLESELKKQMDKKKKSVSLAKHQGGNITFYTPLFYFYFFYYKFIYTRKRANASMRAYIYARGTHHQPVK